MENPPSPVADPVGDPVGAYDVVLLAGGAGRRLGGMDKAMLSLGGRTLLERLLTATAGARRRVVVGPRRPLGSGWSHGGSEVLWAREEPPGSGPLAALTAGVGTLSSALSSAQSSAKSAPPGSGHDVAPVVLVLAVDQPFVDAEVCQRLLAAVATADAGVLVDSHARLQPLAAAYDRRALDAALARIGDPRDRPVRLVLDGLDVTEVHSPWAARDVDDPSDVEMMMLIDWTRQLAEALEVDDELADLDLDAILDLARDAAHAVERPAAPVTTFLVGYAAARRGDGPELITDLIRRAGELARAQEEQSGASSAT